MSDHAGSSAVLDLPEDSTPPEKTARSPLDFIHLTGRAALVRDWIGVVVGVYVLITAVKVIGAGFKIAVGDQAQQLFSFADNPLIALMIGLLATALTQSSSTTTSVTVGLVAGGLPLHIAIPMLMGANMGTTMTNTLVSLGMAKDKNVFRRAFAAATVHDFFNLFAVTILLPIELMFGVLERASGALSGAMAGGGSGPVGAFFTAIGNTVSAATEPLADAILWSADAVGMPAVAEGIVLAVVGVALILLVINKLGQLLKVLMVGRAKRVLHTAIARGPVTGIVSGCLITMAVQSSSTTTSLAVPLAGSGTFSLKQIYPVTVGANIGTTITALIAAFAFTGAEGVVALQTAFVHVLFNVFGALIVFGIPLLHSLPMVCATKLADLSAENKAYAITWSVGAFLVVPFIAIALTTWVF